MKLKRREKILVGTTIGMIVLAGVWFLLLGGDSRTDEQLSNEQTKLTGEIEEKQKLLQAAARDAKRLADWQRRALPPDAALARSLYQNWLRGLMSRANLRNTNLVANEAGARRDQFTRLSFDIRARASLSEVVQFLYEFYSAGYLHQIRKIDLKPTQGSRDLEVIVAIEALSLPTAVSKDQLAKEPRHELTAAKTSDKQEPKLADYRDPIAKRDFFAPYTPRVIVRQEREERPGPKPLDPAEFAYITGFTEVDGAEKVWLHDRMANKLWQLGPGEGFTVGNGKGTVQTIHPEGEVIVAFDGRHRLLHDGDNLRGGVELKDEPPKSVATEAKRPRMTASEALRQAILEALIGVPPPNQIAKPVNPLQTTVRDN